MTEPRLLAPIVALALLAGLPLSAQQSAGPLPPSLDEMIATALKASPEVLLAEAKLRQAQAELNQARLRVTREVVTAASERKQKQTTLGNAERELATISKSAAAGNVASSDVDKARARLGEAELGIAQSDADLRYLLGIGSQLDPRTFREAGPQRPDKEKPAFVERPQEVPAALVAALARKVNVRFEDLGLADAMKALADQGSASILIDPQSFPDPASFKISLTLRDDSPLSTVLQALSDQHDLVFVLRDYGILTTLEDRARVIAAPTVPPNVPLIADHK